MVAGALRDRCVFERAGVLGDGAGGRLEGWTPIAGLTRIRGMFKPARGGETVEAGGVESTVSGTLKIRASVAAHTVTAADRVIINGVDYAIGAITNPDRRNKYLELTVTRGGAI